MIKVGQIWDKNKSDTFRGKVCVTNIYKYENGTLEVDYITNSGICYSHDDEYFLKLNRKCIAEYPTWQEAVNSKEFNDIVSDTVNDIVNSKEFNDERQI